MNLLESVRNPPKYRLKIQKPSLKFSVFLAVIPIAGDHITVQKYLDVIAAGFGGTAKLVSVPFEQFGKFGFPGAEEVAHMCEWFNQYGYFGPGADLEWARKLAPELQRFEDWFAKNKSLFQIVNK
jgi:hypothetical protein